MNLDSLEFAVEEGDRFSEKTPLDKPRGPAEWNIVDEIFHFSSP
jgi:hypothetical protein